MANGMTARRLTSREWEVLELLAQGRSTVDIARRLVLSASAVRVHGLAGFLGKDKKIGQIAEALDVIAAGGEVFDRPRGLPHREPARPSRHAPYALTPREKEVLRRIVAGQTTRQMSGEMGIETSTLRTYMKNLLTKLGVHTRLAAAALATREDLLGDKLGPGPWPARAAQHLHLA